jgi:hypothetical protein
VFNVIPDSNAELRARLRTLVLAAGLATVPAYAADAPPDKAEPALEPKALDALKSMGSHMREMKSFAVHADTTIDQVTEDGQKLQFGGTVDFKVRRPDRLRADVDSDRRQRTYYYDGKTVTQYSPRMGYYASVSAPGTLHELVSVLQDKYGISLPLTDLFQWGVDPDDGSGLTGAAYIGPAKVNDTVCEHYAYRQPDVDWQVWIAQKTELPCKLIITTTEEPTEPQYTAVFTWHPSVAFNDATFEFAKPKTAHKIEIAVVDESGN